VINAESIPLSTTWFSEVSRVRSMQGAAVSWARDVGPQRNRKRARRVTRSSFDSNRPQRAGRGRQTATPRLQQGNQS
jgi:hypothetical protein